MAYGPPNLLSSPLLPISFLLLFPSHLQHKIQNNQYDRQNENEMGREDYPTVDGKMAKI